MVDSHISFDELPQAQHVSSNTSASITNCLDRSSSFLPDPILWHSKGGEATETSLARSSVNVNMKAFGFCDWYGMAAAKARSDSSARPPNNSYALVDQMQDPLRHTSSYRPIYSATITKRLQPDTGSILLGHCSIC